MNDSCKIVGRYALGSEIASGGMATLHLGRLVGSAGFSRTVAIKRLHPQFCADPNFGESFADEARLAARIRHPNVVPTLDVVSTKPDPASGRRELLLVMEYIDGESLSALSRACSARIPLPIVVAIVSEMLHGLHSAHEATSETGQPLGIVHRDVSPQNVLVGADGVARLVDFGIARATSRVGTTEEGEIKGKIAYMAPEQIRREPVTRATDLFAAGIVLWELLTGQRLFASDNVGATLEKILVGWVAPPSSIARDLPSSFDEIALRALDADPANRFATAREMAVALEDAAQRALGRDVGAWVEATAGETLRARRELVARAERAPQGPLESTIMAPPMPRPGRSTRSNPVFTPPDPRPDPREETQTRALLREDGNLGMTTHPPETDRTMTVFSASDSARLHGAPITLPPPPPPPRGIAAAKAGLTFFLAAAITVLVGARYVGVRSASASADRATPHTVAVAAGATAIAVPSVRTVAPTPAPTDGFVAPPPTAPLAVVPAAPHSAAVVPSPAVVPPPFPAQVRRFVRPRPAPARTPCVAKLDPATGKTVYKGDCD